MTFAVITAVRNEEDLLPQFLSHYDRQGADRIFILDNGSTDRTVEVASRHPKVVLSSFQAPDIGFDKIRLRAVMAKKDECRGRYDFVVLADSDEFVIPSGGGTIRSALESVPGQYDLCSCRGFVMVETPGDPPYDPGIPLVDQRRKGFPDDLYSKPIIVRPGTQADYALGFHSVGGISKTRRLHGKFLLLHYTGPNEEIFVKRRLQMEPRILPPKKQRSREIFVGLYRSWQAHPQLMCVF